MSIFCYRAAICNIYTTMCVYMVYVIHILLSIPRVLNSIAVGKGFEDKGSPNIYNQIYPMSLLNGTCNSIAKEIKWYEVRLITR